MGNPIATSTRVSKIAQLPVAVRDELNRRMLNGELSPRLLPWINELAETKQLVADRFDGALISAQNISDWRRTGYRDWLKSSERIAHTKELSSYAAALARSNGGRLAEGAQAIAGGRILEILEATGGQMDLDSIQALVECLGNLRSGEIQQQRADQDAQKLKQKDEQLKLERQKFELLICNKLLDAGKLAKAREIAESDLDNAAKIEALRKEYFSDVDALEQSGEVQIPK